MGNYAVRKASAKDIAIIEELILEWLEFTPRWGRTKSIRDSVAKEEILVAVSKFRVVGFIHCVVHDDIIDGGPNAFITALYVTPSCRRKGVGSSLLQHLVAGVTAKGALEIETSTTKRDGRRFYENLG